MSIINCVELPDGSTYNVTLPALSDGFTTTAGSSTSGSYLATRWAVPSVNGITAPVDGMTIAVRVPLDGASGGIVFSIDGGANYYPIVRNVNTLVTTNYAVGAYIILTFNSTASAKPYLTAGTATSVTGCWQIADYDANTRNTVGAPGVGDNAEIFNDYTNNTASGTYSHAEGSVTAAFGTSSHAEGYGATAGGAYSHAEGNGTTTNGHSSHAEGNRTTAEGDYSHAEGYGAKASGEASHAEGNGKALGLSAHAEGTGKAEGVCSHAEGHATYAYSNYQHAEGRYNKVDYDNQYLHIAGNGNEEDSRSNAYTLDWSGNGWFAGNLTAAGLASSEGSFVVVGAGGELTAQEGSTTAQSATLTTTWSEQSDGSYAQTVSVTGVTDSNNVVVDCALTGSDIDADIAVLEGWGCVNRATQDWDSMTFYCYGDVPTVSIPLNVVVM